MVSAKVSRRLRRVWAILLTTLVVSLFLQVGTQVYGEVRDRTTIAGDCRAFSLGWYNNNTVFYRAPITTDDKEAPWHIVKLTLDGVQEHISNPKNVLEIGAVEFNPVNSRFYYTQYTGDDFEVFVMQENSQQGQLLGQFDGHVTGFEVRRDGSLRVGNDLGQYWYIQPDNVVVTPFTGENPAYESPHHQIQFNASVLSPRDARIEFASQLGQAVEIYRSGVTGEPLWKSDPYHTVWHIEWSPDGENLLFAASSREAPYRYVIVDKDGSNLRDLTPHIC